MRLAILDNRDSFIWNIVHLAHQSGADVRLFDGESDDLAAVQSHCPDAVIVGPGPGHPDQSRLSFELFRAYPDLPVLGICLGHQVLARLHGATIARSKELGHGRAIDIHHAGAGLFQGVPDPCHGGRYHSLCVTELPATLLATAHSLGGELMAIADPVRPHFGVQFHPESLLADCGAQLLANFFALA
jgi:anthranilate synthase/aminodeoxychorismate synthase-like glutamine amidotransferase